MNRRNNVIGGAANETVVSVVLIANIKVHFCYASIHSCCALMSLSAFASLKKKRAW